MPRTSQALFGIGLIAIGACLGANLDATGAASTARAEDAKNAEPLDVRYAQLFLRQSQLDLERALDTNRRMPGSFQSTVIDALRRTVAVAQNWVDESTARSKSTDFNPCLLAAESQAKHIRDEYAKIQEIERLAPKSVNPIDMERAKVALALAELRIERAEAIDPKSSGSIMQMQIELLREQIVELETRAAKLEARN
jgi:hypothetical protein